MASRKFPPLALLLLAASGAGGAAQVRQARDGATVEAVVSRHEPTRIRIEGEKIVDVVGNIVAGSNCEARHGENAAPASTPTPAIEPHGDVLLSCDLAKGEIYLRPTGASTKPINLFISSARATYTLLLRQAEGPADTIVLRDPHARGGDAGSGMAPGHVAGHVRRLKGMLLAMTAPVTPDDIRTREIDEPKSLWREAEMRLVRTFDGRGLAGETYVLRNVSGAPMVLAEQEFDRDDGQVLAVAIEQLNLRPNESTRVHVIRMGGE